MKDEIIQEYRSALDDKEFDRWLTANAVIGSLFAAALIGMAVFGAIAPAPTQSAEHGVPGEGVRRTKHPTVDHDDVVGTVRRAPAFSASQGGLAPD